MNSRPFPLLLAAALAISMASLPALGQEDRKPVPPAPPSPQENPQRSPEAERNPGPPLGRFGPRHDAQRGPEEARRPEDGPRHDGEGGLRGGPGGERSWNIPLPPPAPPVPTAYVGVVTEPPPAVLSAQLGLKEGFGLVVGEVLPDSPASKAGLKKYDVVTKFNDQQLVDAGQFSTLVKAAGKDSDATLTIIRVAKEQTVPVKIGERMAPQRMPFPGGFDLRRQMEPWKGPPQDGMKRMREYGEKMHDYEERLRGWKKNPTGDAPEPPQLPALQAENGGIQINPIDILVEAQPGGTKEIRLFQPNAAVSSYYTADTKMMMKDDKGEIEVSTKDGKRILIAKDTKGATIFDGPIDTEEQRKSLPEEIRKKLEMIQVRTAVSAIASPGEAPVLPPAGGGENVQ